MVRSSLEHQVFQQVSHAGLTICLVSRTDEVGDVDSNRGLALVREQQHAQTIVLGVFRDPLHRSDLCDLLGHHILRSNDQQQHGKHEPDAGTSAAHVDHES